MNYVVQLTYYKQSLRNEADGRKTGGAFGPLNFYGDIE